MAEHRLSLILPPCHFVHRLFMIALHSSLYYNYNLRITRSPSISAYYIKPLSTKDIQRLNLIKRER